MIRFGIREIVLILRQVTVVMFIPVIWHWTSNLFRFIVIVYIWFFGVPFVLLWVILGGQPMVRPQQIAQYDSVKASGYTCTMRMYETTNFSLYMCVFIMHDTKNIRYHIRLIWKKAMAEA